MLEKNESWILVKTTNELFKGIIFTSDVSGLLMPLFLTPVCHCHNKPFQTFFLFFIPLTFNHFLYAKLKSNIFYFYNLSPSLSFSLNNVTFFTFDCLKQFFVVYNKQECLFEHLLFYFHVDFRTTKGDSNCDLRVNNLLCS